MSSDDVVYESISSLDDLKARFESYENGVRGSYLFVNNLVKLVETLMGKIERLDKEAHGLLNTNRELEQDNASIRERLNMYENMFNKVKFAAIILDGDGMIFSKDLLSSGFEGGREAAIQLHTYACKALKSGSTTKLHIHVFANVINLAPILAQAAIIPKVDVFHEFVNGFNTVDELITFSNIGRGREPPDSKVNGLIKAYVAMPQCQNIILGASHDNSYARLLSKLETDNIAPGKVILLQGPSFAPELERFDTKLFPRMKFGELFLDRKLDLAKKYAQVAADGVLPMIRKTASPPSPSAATNSYKLAEPELSVWLSVKNLSPRACNMFYLNPQKCSKPDCEYSHEHNLSDVQLAALRYNCKKQLCRAYQQSDACPYRDDCIYGHDCPDNIGGKCATGKKCKLIHPQ